ncbi:hypothetical protein I312_100586 [Cryptococcus bacillisporus CA1280]|uniref:Uncharacterized protein n=2 Tax=Cryptococcus gattii TaxID=552467 RepID=A0A0D0VFI8_CRYGA|nr:hypothetical protein I312_04267 [Cryptococcus bacillisporus CA1280]KIR59694.1 hypothetical protein I314_04690 [Cryptococcus bacillisporus CA1873]|eukprot:KIR59694.1 hypothetical protein I314_04690 [Cryptococcus gattii CA1873]
MDRTENTTTQNAPLPSSNSRSSKHTSVSLKHPIVAHSLIPCSPPPTRCTLSDKDGRFDERWDVYFHAFLLHETKHSDCYYYKGQWWFPENRRNEHTLHMFVAASDLKYYNLHLPNGKIMENLMFRYVGQSNPQEEWLHDYVGYNLNLVTIDMQVMSP